MTDPKIREYIEKERKQGASDLQIREALVANGWKIDEIEEALGSEERPQTEVAIEMPGILSLLKESLRLYGEQFSRLLAIALVPAVTIIVAVALLSVCVGLVVMSGGNRIVLAGVVLLAIVVIVVAVLISFWSNAALVLALRDRREQRHFGELFRNARALVVPLFTTSLLSFVFVLGGIVFFLIPGIILAVLLTFAVYAVVYDNAHNTAALLKSRELVVGRWWKIFWYLVIIAVVVGVIQYLVGVLFDAVGTSGEEASLVASILNFCFKLVLVPFVTIYSLLLYEHVRFLPPKPAKRSSEAAKRWMVAVSGAGYIIMLIFSLLNLVG